MEDRKFISKNTVSKDEFLAQFEDKTIEIVVDVCDVWHKGVRPFPLFGKESLVSVRYHVPWSRDPEGVLGAFGDIFWFTKKSFFGYPYKPEFKPQTIYRLRVRPCSFSDRPKFRYYFLEEILEQDVDLTKDESIYKNAKDHYFSETEEEVKELLVCVTKNLDVSENKQKTLYYIGNSITGISSVRYADTGEARMISGLLEVPFDNRDFSENRKIKLKAGRIYRITARRRTAQYKKNSFILDKILEENVEDDELVRLSAEKKIPGKWSIEGLGEFEMKDAEVTGDIQWDPADEQTFVSFALVCDDDDPKKADKATAHFLKILADRKAFEQAVFNCMVDEMADENSMVDTWEGESEGEVSRTREEVLKRLSVSHISLEPDGSGEVFVDLDEMFTDHCYVVDINEDGTFEPHGLMG